MPSRKIHAAMKLRAVDFGKGISLVTFFVPAKKVTRALARKLLTDIQNMGGPYAEDILSLLPGQQTGRRQH